MTYTVNYDKKNDCILVVINGELTLSLLKCIAADVSEFVKQKGCRHVLNDLRNARPSRSTLEIYKMPAEAKKAGVKQSLIRALVVGDKLKEFSFLETIFVNRGHIVQMFETIDEARAWLEET